MYMEAHEKSLVRLIHLEREHLVFSPFLERVVVIITRALRAVRAASRNPQLEGDIPLPFRHNAQ